MDLVWVFANSVSISVFCGMLSINSVVIFFIPYSFPCMMTTEVLISFLCFLLREWREWPSNTDEARKIKGWRVEEICKGGRLKIWRFQGWRKLRGRRRELDRIENVWRKKVRKKKMGSEEWNILMKNLYPGLLK